MFNTKGGNQKKSLKKTKMVTDARLSYTNLRNEDTASIATLPNDWTPKRGGPILANYLKEREKNHNAVIEELNAKKSKINQDIETEVKELAETLLNHIQKFEYDILQGVEECKSNNELMTTATRNAVFKKNDGLYEALVEDIATFKLQGVKLENKRVELLRKLMKDQFQIAIKIGHYPPTDLEADFSARMYEMNNVSFNNLRAYEELEAELKADAEKKMTKARSVLNQLSIGTRTVFRSGSASHHSSGHSIYSLQPPVVKRSLSVGQRKQNFDPKLINKILQSEVDHCLDQLIEAYRTGLISMFNGFKGQLKDLRKNLTYGDFTKNDNSFMCLNDVSAAVAKASGGVSDTLYQDSSKKSKHLVQETEADVLNIQKSLASLGKCLRYTYAILYDAGHLCDSHLLRTAIVQKLTITAVEEMLTNNDLAEQSRELEFNLALEKMVTAPNEAVLKLQYDALRKMLDEMEQMYELHSKAEIARLEEYMTLPPLLTDILLAECRVFLNCNPKYVSTTLSNNSLLLIGMLNQPKPITLAILQTELQKTSLDNWRNGFLEGLENSIRQIPEELVNHANMWVIEKSRTLVNRRSLKMASHSIRSDRIKAFYEQRLAVLRYHKTRLESHVNAVGDLISNLSEILEAKTSNASELYPITEWVKLIKEDMETVLSKPDMDPEVRRLKMSSYAIRLIKHRQLFEKTLDEVLENVKQEMEHRLQNARISNIRFCGMVALFYERGNYSVAEAAEVMSAVSKAMEDIEKAGGQVPKTLESRRAELLAMVDLEIQPLQKLTHGYLKPKDKKEKSKSVVFKNK